MIKKTVYIVLLLAAVVAVVFAAINRPNTHTLLPLGKRSAAAIETATEPDSLTIESDSVEVTLPASES